MHDFFFALGLLDIVSRSVRAPRVFGRARWLVVCRFRDLLQPSSDTRTRRFDELKIVMQAVVRPRKALGLTAVLFFVIQYLFTVWGFGFLRQQYPCDECVSAQQRLRVAHVHRS